MDFAEEALFHIFSESLMHMNVRDDSYAYESALKFDCFIEVILTVYICA